MSDIYVLAMEGIADELADLSKLPPHIIRTARMTVNSATRRARTIGAREIRRQVNLPARYLSGKTSRLTITKLATDSDLEGVVSGRRRPTSLARFVTGSPKVGQRRRSGGLTVEVKPGFARRMPGAFLMKLRAGAADISEAFNVGLAVRTKDGKKPTGAYKPLALGNGLWFLYGPSVDQVFNETRKQIAPDLKAFMRNEFNRLRAAKS